MSRSVHTHMINQKITLIHQTQTWLPHLWVMSHCGEELEGRATPAHLGSNLGQSRPVLSVGSIIFSTIVIVGLFTLLLVRYGVQLTLTFASILTTISSNDGVHWIVSPWLPAEPTICPSPAPAPAIPGSLPKPTFKRLHRSDPGNPPIVPQMPGAFEYIAPAEASGGGDGCGRNAKGAVAVVLGFVPRRCASLW
jgi:hypothetical protein